MSRFRRSVGNRQITLAGVNVDTYGLVVDQSKINRLNGNRLGLFVLGLGFPVLS